MAPKNINFYFIFNFQTLDNRYTFIVTIRVHRTKIFLKGFFFNGSAYLTTEISGQIYKNVSFSYLITVPTLTTWKLIT